MESAGADVDLTMAPYVTRITGYNAAIALDVGAVASSGWVKVIRNDSGSEVVINSGILVQGADTDTITLAAAAGSYVMLIYLSDPDVSERFRDLDSSGLTLS